VALLLWAVVYRNQMASDGDEFWSSPFMAMSSSTDVVALMRENPAARWSYGPTVLRGCFQLLEQGGVRSDTREEGVIGALPTLIVQTGQCGPTNTRLSSIWSRRSAFHLWTRSQSARLSLTTRGTSTSSPKVSRGCFPKNHSPEACARPRTKAALRDSMAVSPAV